NMSLLPLDHFERFPIPHITEEWILPLVLSVIPAASDEVARLVLTELSDSITAHPPITLLTAENWVMWFFPILFDEYESNSRSLDSFHLCVNILCTLLVHHVLTY